MSYGIYPVEYADIIVLLCFGLVILYDVIEFIDMNTHIVSCLLIWSWKKNIIAIVPVKYPEGPG